MYNQCVGFDLQKTVAQLRSDLPRLCKQRDFAERELVNKCLALTSLARQIEDKQERDKIFEEIAAARSKPGLTERISKTLRQMPHADLGASEVRQWLEREGVDLSDYSQPLATISITLSRMAKSGRVKAKRHGRKVTYRWNGD